MARVERFERETQISRREWTTTTTQKSYSCIKEERLRVCVLLKNLFEEEAVNIDVKLTRREGELIRDL